MTTTTTTASASAALLLLLIATTSATAASLDRIRVRPSDRQFVDSLGRVRVFHGINDVNKLEPYLSSFTNEELARMNREWGFNLMRLGFSWEGYERAPGIKDPAYMAANEAIVTQLAQHGMWTIMDVHQDLYSRVYCGNGFPSWTVHVDPAISDRAPFPIPVLGRNVSYEPDPVTGHITPQDCSRSYWGTYYFSAVTGSMFESFYADTNGIQTAFVDMWADIARAFVGRPELFGHEIINEPFPGNIYTTPRLLLNSSYADLELLAPLYERVHRVVRAVDNDTMLLFEPLVSNSEILPRKAGFKSGPGGSEYVDRDVYAFHWYCMELEQRPNYCDRFLDISFEQRERDAERMGVARILTEFGFFAGDMAGDTTWLCNKADEGLVSWTNWEYKVIKNQPETIRALARTYAQAIAGTPVRHVFNADTNEFVLVYTIDTTIQAPTEIFVPTTLRYLNGVRVTVEPARAAQWSQPEPHYVFVTATPNALPNERVTVTITPL